MRKLSLLCLMLLLSACGGSDHRDDIGANMPPPPATGGNAAPDAFTAQVAMLVATQPENTEPLALDGIAPSMPETTEPVPVTP